MDADLIARGWALAKTVLRPARREPSAPISSPAPAASAATPRFGTEIAKGGKENGPQGIPGMSGRELPPGSPPRRSHGAQMSGQGEVPGFKENLHAAFSPPSMRTGAKILSGVAAQSRTRARLVRCEDRRRQFDPAVAPLSAGLRRRPRASGPARTRTSISSPCCSAPRRVGWSCSPSRGNWIPAAPPPGALVINVGDMLQRLYHSCVALDQPPRRQPAARAPPHSALLPCPSSSIWSPR